MKIGDTIGTATLVAQIANARWQGTTAQGSVVEIRLGDAATGFDTAWAGLRDAHGVAVPAVSDVLRSEDHVAVVHEPLDPLTVAGLKGPIPAAALAFIGMRVATAISRAGAHLTAPLIAADIGLDLQGHPVLAPSPARDVALPSTRAAAAPEASPGRDAALYGLGVVLYRLGTGSLPTGSSPEAPSKRQPGLPAAIDEAVLGLMSANPARRAPAARALAAIAQPVDLRTYADRGARFERATMAPGQVKLTTTSRRQTSASVDRRVPEAAVVLDGDVLATLPPAALSHLAGVTELPIAAIRDAARERRTLVVQALANRRAASSTAIAVQRELQIPLASAARPRFVRAFEILFFLGASGVSALLALALGSGGLAVVSVVALLLSLVSVVGAFRTSRDFQVAVAAHAHQEDIRSQAPGHIPAVASRRRSLAVRDLPEPVERDAREALDDLEDPHLSDEVVHRGLTAIDQLLADSDTVGGDGARAAEQTAALARRTRQETSQ